MKSKILNLTKYLLIFAFIAILLVFLSISNNIKVYATSNLNTENCKSAVLIENNSKKVLFNKNAHYRHPIASVTKLMTILLTLEEIDAGNISLTDKVLVSQNANGMGGSQIFLDANVEYELGELLKSVIVASANDSSVALAEHIAGSENNFVRLMNEKAGELGLKNTFYSNCTGLPTTDAYSSAYDQAIVLSNVLKFDTYHNYSSIWLEDFAHPSGRTTQMTNTNKLSKFYSGCIGGKTGSTNQAKYCLAVGAKRNNMNLISVVLGAENSKERFRISSELLDYGFENFVSKTIFDNTMLKDKTIRIKGMGRVANLKAEREFNYVYPKNETINYSLNYNLPNILLKVKENQVVGNVEIIIDGKVVDSINLLSTETFNEATIWDYFKDIIKI